MKKLLVLMFVCSPAFAQNVILDARGNAYMYSFKSGNQTVYTDSRGTPIAYSLPSPTPRPAPAWEQPYPATRVNTPMMLELPSPAPVLPTAAQMFPVPSLY